MKTDIEKKYNPYFLVLLAIYFVYVKMIFPIFTMIMSELGATPPLWSHLAIRQSFLVNLNSIIFFILFFIYYIYSIKWPDRFRNNVINAIFSANILFVFISVSLFILTTHISLVDHW